MSLNPNALCNVAEAKVELRTLKSQDDIWLERAINALSQTFETLSDYLLVQRTLTGYRADGTGNAWLNIPIVPVQSVSQIEIRDALTDAVSKTITDTNKFLLKGKDTYGASLSGLLQLTEDTFEAGLDNIALNLVAGFPVSHPKRAEAQRLFFMQLVFEYARYQNRESGLVSKTMADGSISFFPPANLLKEVEDGLNVLRAHRL